MHGPLVAADASGLTLRYEQHHRTAGDYAREGSPDFDGVAEQWFASLEDFERYLAQRNPEQSDNANFLAMDDLIWIVTEEPEVMLDKLGDSSQR